MKTTSTPTTIRITISGLRVSACTHVHVSPDSIFQTSGHDLQSRWPRCGVGGSNPTTVDHCNESNLHRWRPRQARIVGTGPPSLVTNGTPLPEKAALKALCLERAGLRPMRVHAQPKRPAFSNRRYRAGHAQTPASRRLAIKNKEGREHSKCSRPGRMKTPARAPTLL